MLYANLLVLEKYSRHCNWFIVELFLFYFFSMLRFVVHFVVLLTRYTLHLRNGARQQLIITQCQMIEGNKKLAAAEAEAAVAARCCWQQQRQRQRQQQWQKNVRRRRGKNGATAKRARFFFSFHFILCNWTFDSLC